MSILKKLTLSMVCASALSFSACSSNPEQGVDLGHILDVFIGSMDTFESNTVDESTKEASNGVMNEFADYTEKKLNSPSFTKKPVGLELKADGSFEGYADKNGNSTRESGEDTTFTVEIDTENNYLIATDMTGESTGMRFSGASFLAGAILGNIMSRQRKSGVSSSSFRNRNVKPRSSYSSARSSSFSGSHSSGK